MSVIYGLTDDGFIPKPLQVLRDEINAALQAAFGESIELGDQSLLGVIIGIIVERLALLWELLDAINASQDPDKATGAALVAICAYTGTVKPSARASTATLTLFGTPGTSVTGGSRVTTASTGVTFATDEDITIIEVPAWAPTTDYALDDRTFTFNTNVRIYQVITPGTSGGTPVSGTGSDITDGTVHWMMIQDNVPNHGAVDVPATATITGPVTAVAGDLTEIINGVDGWDTVTNLLDAEPGRDEATDAELKTLRVQELSGEGQAVVDAIQLKLLKIPGVLSVVVFVNETDSINADGMPPHSVEALVRTTWAAGNAKDQIIYDTLLATVAAGVATTGNQIGTAIDLSNVIHTVKFSRAVEVPVYVDVTLIKDAISYPSDGDAQVKAAVAALGNAPRFAGTDAVAARLASAVFSVSGVIDVPRSGSLGGVLISKTPSPTTDATIAITTRQVATYDTSRITLHTSNGTF